jgi:MFS family permease
LIDVPSGNLKRVWTAFLVFTAQQATGATAFAYFGPQYFKLIVGDDDEASLLLTAIFGAVKLGACGFFVIFLADRISRRGVMIGGAVFMAACQITTAAVVKAIPGEEGNITSAGIATIALIYMFVMAYNLSWGPLPWPYVAEIFPSRIREPGMAVGVATQWLFNFTFSIATPYMIADLQW